MQEEVALPRTTKKARALFAWGRNNAGQLGLGAPSPSPPAPTATERSRGEKGGHGGGPRQHWGKCSTRCH